MISSNLKKVNTKKCRYCGVSRHNSEMTRIPDNREKLSTWIQILGPRFAENIKRYKNNYICLNHIENQERGKYRLPKNLNNVSCVNSKPRINVYRKGHFRICRYCGVSRRDCDMTNVTKIPEQLSKWIEILGPKFAANIKQFKANYICIKHIKNSMRGRMRLPKKMQESKSRKEGKGNKKQTQMKVNEKNNSRSERIRKRQLINSSFADVEIDDTDQELDDVITQSVSINVEDEVEKNTGEIGREQNEVMEEEEEDRNFVEMVPPTTEVSDWTKMKVEQESKPVIVIMKSEVVENDRDIVEMVPPKWEVPESYVVDIENHIDPNLKNTNMNDDFIQCRVCGLLSDRKMMKEAPTDTDELERWVKILGSVFFGNIVKNLPPHFVCDEDLRKLEQDNPAAEL